MPPVLEDPACFPISDTAPRASPARIVLTLILINTIVFLWMWSLPKQALDDVTVKYALIPLRYSDPEARDRGRAQPQRLAAADHQHFHAWRMAAPDPQHVDFVDFRAGDGGALRASWLRGVLHLRRVFPRASGHLITNWDSNTPALGASGAIAAVIAAYAVIYPHARVLFIVPLGIIFIPLSAPAVLFAVLWFGIQVLEGTHDLFAPSMAGGIAWWAHIGGFLFGALAALPVRYGVWGAHVHTFQRDLTDWRSRPRGRFPGPWSRD